MKKLLIIGLVLIVGMLASVSCAASSPAPSIAPEPTVTVQVPAPMPAPAPMSPGREEAYSETKDGSPVAVSETGQTGVTERMIVRIGNMWLVVDDVPIAMDQIIELTDSFDGYVVSSQRWKEGERLVGSIVVRVPAEHFEGVVRILREMAVEVVSEDTSSRDVTEEYVDLNAKLGNLEATEEQLLRLMEKAEKVEDILNVQRELSRTRGEIEQTKGRMQYLERTSATSLIEIHLEQAKLDVSFTASRNRVKEGEEIEFDRRIAGGFAPYSFEWDFGDGNTSTSEYPAHSYKDVGSYTVTLVVTDDRGNTDTETRDEYILVRPGWNVGSTASSAWNGLIAFGRVLVDIITWLGIFSPVWIVIGGIIYWRRRRRKKSSS